MSKPIDPVVIRVWREKDGDVFALFPVLSADNNGYHCTSYQHIGQHGAADYRLCIDRSRPATAEEAAPLLAELKAIGYNPRVYKRQTRAMRDIRRGLAHNPDWCCA